MRSRPSRRSARRTKRPPRRRRTASQAASIRANMRVPRPWMLPLFAAAGMTLVPLAAARAQLGTSDNNNPISIEADSGIEWQQNQQLYIARGNATAIRGQGTIKADTLI